MKNANAFMAGQMANIAAAVRVAGFFMLTAAMIPVHLFYLHAKPAHPFQIPLVYHRLLLRLLGFRVRVRGSMAQTTPVLFVANHTSYLDIPVLGALIPATFVAKSEVSSWPMIGFLAKLQGTIFIERRAARAGDQRDFLSGYLAQGKSLILFPEGTSSDGLTVLPFKSGLFSIVENACEQTLTIQPISVACTGLDGLPLIRAWRPFYAWYGDMTLLGHLWNVFKMGRFTVDVVFHPPVMPTTFPDRKALAAYCQQQVARGIEQCLTGRQVDAVKVPQLPAPVQPAAQR